MAKSNSQPKIKIPSLPKFLERKIYKTGQTRGADDDVIYQNRVGRNSTVIIPYLLFDLCKEAPDNEGKYENSFIVLIKPERYFCEDIQNDLEAKGLEIGRNALLFYETRAEWSKYNPEEKGLLPATSRTNPLGGHYVARVPATTSEGQTKILRGYTATNLKGAGIRVYEYASKDIFKKCTLQLEYIFWHCMDAEEVALQCGMTEENIKMRVDFINNNAKILELDNNKNLIESRILNPKGHTICPLCLEPISAIGFISRLEQAEGREVPDLTVTQVNLFHIKELRYGEFNHKPYNLGWGHHHCNVVVKDTGIAETVTWMTEVVERNQAYSEYQAKMDI
ncbi:BstXI family restriction endonuclease [Siphonobacter sp. SORGH_AS_0500]|uniref:BstXI family restriction endonuclease n=1 Tax=Siphonobacter sp. SORGH_AS_0500 TaxID=1864824 RepID=UPI00285AED56|nr:BstXI family restriction endonuclease [Siphonobacter sp. SORGH_AS_0500]MDR6197097.1 hypothetical protein [Siphonobacter sp. SORGH_AS_0500]